MNSDLSPRDTARLPSVRPTPIVPQAEAPPPPADTALAIGLLLAILFFGIPMLLFCVLTSG
ncbi:hypothetical protein QP166_09490 [Sphingomonas sp. LR60]|uniref:hypothetical protein n=1 Tax=Sphingomonas sp. LR60 TaxID=3050233 RepID=UPI002FE2356C